MFNLIKVLECGNKFLFANGKGDYLVASYSTAFANPECLLFKSSNQGEIEDWAELYGQKFGTELVPSVPKNEAVFSVVTQYNNLLAKDDYTGAWS